MSTQSGTATLYPPGGFGAPKNRRGHAGADVGLPTGTEVFSADNHISLA
ncbi:MAG: amidohydrolase, partial [Mycobacterium sp.]